MAETKELRHAGIGIDLNVNGLEEFRKANSMLDDFMRSFHEITGQADKLKESLGSGLNISRDVNQSKESMAGFQSEFRKTAQQADIFKHNLDFSNVGAKDTESMRKLNDQVKQISGKPIEGISGNFKKVNESIKGSKESLGKYHERLDELNSASKKTFDGIRKGSGLVKKVVGAALVSNAVISSWYALKGGISNALKAGKEYDKEQQVMSATWQTLTGSAKKGQKMVKAINDISVKFGQSASLVNELNQQFYHVFNKQGPTDRLTKSLLTMADTLGMGAENTKRLGLNFTHMMASSKMQLGDFNMISDQLPMFGEKLLEYERKAMKNSHLTMSQLRADMSAGKVSAKDAEAVMNGLGKKYAKASENMMKTLPGMERVMSARGSALFGALEKPFMKAKNPIFSAISKWVSDKNTEKEFTKVGSAASKGLNTITKAFAKVFNPNNAPHFADEMMQSLAKSVTDISRTIASHAQSIVEFFRSFYYSLKILKDIGLGFFKGIASGLSAIATPVAKMGSNSKHIRSFSDSLASISKHSKGLQTAGKILAGMFAAKKLLGMGTGILGLRKHILEFTSSTRLMGSAIKLLPWALWIAGIAAAIAILVKLYQHDKKFRKFVNGIMASVRKMAKSFKNLWGDAKGIFKNGFKTIESIVNVGIDVLTGDWKGFKKDGVKLIKSFWSLAKDVFKADFDFINDLTGGKLEKMTKAFSNTWKDIGKGWKSFWNGISDWFGDLWKGIVKHVQDGINNVIKVLNSGISGIDSVIHAFGGSSKAIGTINPVHLATGTGALSGQRRAITKPTMAMLNDGHDSPETGNREMLIHPNGMGELIKGTNVMRMLEPGAEVLNATEAKMAMSMQRFASGTGFFSNLWKGTKKVAADAVGGVESGISGIGNFASKAWHGATHLLSTIQKIIAGPGKYLNSLMGKKPSGQGTILSDFAGGFYNSMKKQASTWWSSLWSMASGVLDSSGTGGSWRHDPGLTKTNGFGASRSFGSHDGVDFSGSLGSPILAVHGGKVTHTGRPLHGWPYSQLGDVITVASDDGYQEIYQEFGGMNNIKTSTGDIIKTGQKIATLGHLNGAGSGSHVHIGVSHGSLWDHGGSNTSGWYDVTKMHGKDNGSSKLSHSHTDGAMQKLIKQETGGMMGWIKKHLSPLMDDGGGSMGNLGGAGVQRWRSYVKKALSALNLSTSGSMVDRILRQINTESSGNPKAMGGTDGLSDGHAEGLMQVKPGTFAANKLSGHGNIWNGYDNILAGLNYAKHQYGSGLSFLGNGHGYAKGGKIPKGQLSVVGEKGWELFQPNTSGTVIPHEASERLINGSGKGKVSISAPTKVVIQGNADKSAIDELDSRLEKRNDDLVEKLRELWGLNDEGGLTV
ncbi:tape measure protein (plasmid) [Levilactobacillus brevis]|uniref:Tape measure protein n=1 Tax=Levilactobacillus brevis TaxID=1580 RepID=A0AB38X8W3_LEVBR|nr:tape measure protein [Levilactobacillus brevis]WAD03160.1 tape measure protein [Levilactobacillus brevis]